MIIHNELRPLIRGNKQDWLKVRRTKCFSGKNLRRLELYIGMYQYNWQLESLDFQKKLTYWIDLYSSCLKRDLQRTKWLPLVLQTNQRTWWWSCSMLLFYISYRILLLKLSLLNDRVIVSVLYHHIFMIFIFVYLLHLFYIF